MKEIDKLNLRDILPSSLSDNKLLAISAGIDRVLNRINQKIPRCYIYKNMESTYPEVIDELYWEWHVDYYSEGLTLDKKIKLIRNSYINHKRKGTKWAVENMLNDILSGYSLIEWFEYGGNPYYFKILTENEIPSGEVLAAISKAVKITKNERSHFEGVVQSRVIDSTLNYKYGNYIASDFTFIQSRDSRRV